MHDCRPIITIVDPVMKIDNSWMTAYYSSKSSQSILIWINSMNEYWDIPCCGNIISVHMVDHETHQLLWKSDEDCWVNDIRATNTNEIDVRTNKISVYGLPRKRDMLSLRCDYGPTFTTIFFKVCKLPFELINSTAKRHQNQGKCKYFQCKHLCGLQLGIKLCKEPWISSWV